MVGKSEGDGAGAGEAEAVEADVGCGPVGAAAAPFVVAAGADA